jgi:hypothetical protein
MRDAADVWSNCGAVVVVVDPSGSWMSVSACGKGCETHVDCNARPGRRSRSTGQSHAFGALGTTRWAILDEAMRLTYEWKYPHLPPWSLVGVHGTGWARLVCATMGGVGGRMREVRGADPGPIHVDGAEDASHCTVVGGRGVYWRMALRFRVAHAEHRAQALHRVHTPKHTLEATTLVGRLGT